MPFFGSSSILAAFFVFDLLRFLLPTSELSESDVYLRGAFATGWAECRPVVARCSARIGARGKLEGNGLDFFNAEISDTTATIKGVSDARLTERC